MVSDWMTIENVLTELGKHPRLLAEAELEPIQGTRFQPTGFPDIGAAEYDAPDGTKMLLVESTQSMANRMEMVCWDNTTNGFVEPLRGLPFIAVVDEKGRPLTNSILEAHRINSAYIIGAKNSEIDKKLKEQFGGATFREKERRELARFLFEYDTCSLLHGVFLPKHGGGRCRITRTLSAFVEASNVNQAVSGGVKLDSIDTGKDSNDEEKRASEEGRGYIVYPKIEYTGELKAYFNVDLAEIRGFGLGEKAEKLLEALALFKIQKLLAEGLRLRSACDLRLVSLNVKAPAGFVMPSKEELSEALPILIDSCKKEGLFKGSPSVTETYTGSKKKGKKEENESDMAQESEDGAGDEEDG